MVSAPASDIGLAKNESEKMLSLADSLFESIPCTFYVLLCPNGGVEQVFRPA